MGKRRILIPAAVGGILVIALVAWLRAGDGDGIADSGGMVTVERRAFAATVAAVGAVKPRIGAEVRVGSRVSGRVRRLRANIGDRVERGQVIAELETADLDAIIAQRRAELQVADAKLAAVETRAPGELARAVAEVARFEPSATLAAEAWRRQEELLRERVTTQAEADAARERNLVAQAQLESARRALELVRTGNVDPATTLRQRRA
ncbi:MAG: biotin/lipoyl-binding protein [Gemmatimonadota bacterium]|nr:biotin/lipoyl-binding protein [Gemmatimonadota bacterium]